MNEFDDVEDREIDTELAQQIVVDATPFPDPVAGPDLQLFELGVVNASQVAIHKRRIQVAVENEGFRIKRIKIASGPATSVAECRDSVVDNAV